MVGNLAKAFQKTIQHLALERTGSFFWIPYRGLYEPLLWWNGGYLSSSSSHPLEPYEEYKESAEVPYTL